VAVGRLAEELKRHVDAAHPIQSFKIFNGNRRNTALYSFGILSDIPTLFTPYLDHDLYDFLDSLPRGLMRDRRFREDSITHAYPQYADIPYENEGAPLNATAARSEYVAHAREIARYALRHPHGRWFREGWLIRRLVACLLSRRHAASTYWYLPICSYLLQLESAARRGAAHRDLPTFGGGI
jgi:asparagine synthase (glutamine-hydrolysing)